MADLNYGLIRDSSKGAFIPITLLGSISVILYMSTIRSVPSELVQKAAFCSRLQRSTDEEAQKKILLDVPITSGTYAGKTCEEILKLQENLYRP